MAGGGILTSDWHGHLWSRFAETNSDGINSRFSDLLACLDEIETAIRELKPSWLMMLGDLTHQRHYVRFSIYMKLAEWLARIRKDYDMQVICVVGNHDIENEGANALQPLALMGINVVEQSEYWDLQDFGYALIVPYAYNPDMVVSMIRGHKSRRDTHLFSHYMLDGHPLGGGEYAVSSPLSKSDCDAFKTVWFGHVHKPTVDEDNRITYVGAPLHFDFGDSGQRFAWYVQDKQPTKLIELHGPRFVTTTYPKVPTCGNPRGGFLRVLNTPPQMFEDVKRTGLDNGWRAVMPTQIEMPDEAIKALSSSVSVNEDFIRDYVQRQYPDVDDATRTRIFDFGLSCIREA